MVNPLGFSIISMAETRGKRGRWLYMTENYRGCYEYLSAQFEQVGGYDFYRELFPDNELYGVKYDDFSHPSAVYL